MTLPDPHQHSSFYDGIPTKRFFAWVLDTIAIIGICLLILPFTAFTGLLFFPFLMFVVGFIYRISTLASGSATLGMRAFSMELRDRNDQPLSGSLAFLHTLGYTISFAIAPLQLISIVLMATSTQRQGLTDLALGTAALNRRHTV